MKTRTGAAPKLDINLHAAQSLVFQSDANEILYGGAAGGGKSHLMRLAAVIWAMQIPGLQVYLFRRNFPDLEFNHLSGPSSFHMILAPLIEDGWVQWKASTYEFKFWNGSTIHLCHCQKDDDRFKYLGAEIHVLLIDELSQFTPIVYNFLRTRVRMIGVKVPEGVYGPFPRILCGSNPGGPCHQFMKANWVDKGPPMSYHQSSDDEGGMLRQFIPAKIKDNPSLVEQDPGYMNRIRGMGDANLVKAYLDGDFSVVVGGLFDDLWTPPVHIVKPFRPPPTWYFDRAFDWGSSKPFSVGWFAESNGDPVQLGPKEFKFYPRGTIFQVAEWYGWNGKPDEGINLTASKLAEGVKDIDAALCNSFGVNKIYGGPADASIYSSENNVCIADDMEAEGVYWVPADKGPGSRIQGVQRIRTMLEASLSDSKAVRAELPGYYVFSNCKHTIRVLPVAPRDTVHFEDVAKGYEDHVIDMTRYRLRGAKQSTRTFHHGPN